MLVVLARGEGEAQPRRGARRRRVLGASDRGSSRPGRGSGTNTAGSAAARRPRRARVGRLGRVRSPPPGRRSAACGRRAATSHTTRTGRGRMPPRSSGSGARRVQSTAPSGRDRRMPRPAGTDRERKRFGRSEAVGSSERYAAQGQGGGALIPPIPMKWRRLIVWPRAPDRLCRCSPVMPHRPPPKKPRPCGGAVTRLVKHPLTGCFRAVTQLALAGRERGRDPVGRASSAPAAASGPWAAPSPPRPARTSKCRWSPKQEPVQPTPPRRWPEPTFWPGLAAGGPTRCMYT